MIYLVLKAARAVDNHWFGDLLGAICLFSTGYGLLLIGYGFGL